ncbi:HNH endonuclease signature motif containing protein [Hellea balneolensis]|uniref:HNH endonuclease signature motif containing protein n=1 Tax=Hellea balneolensis TaxID=287478 RepID=UPI0003FA3DDC|nr:HNH endonuclease signature motif containing protein [Hellea balneolensis]
MPDNICPLCDRALGQKREKHHIIPKSKGGTETVLVHPICHRKIHKVFSRTELVKLGTIEALKAHPDMGAFIKWIARRPPDFYGRTR